MLALIPVIIPGSDTAAHPVRRHLLSGPCVLLFILYPDLCDLLTVVSRIETPGVEGDEVKIVDSVRLCLARIGFELGLDI